MNPPPCSQDPQKQGGFIFPGRSGSNPFMFCDQTNMKPPSISRPPENKGWGSYSTGGFILELELIDCTFGCIYWIKDSSSALDSYESLLSNAPSLAIVGAFLVKVQYQTSTSKSGFSKLIIIDNKAKNAKEYQGGLFCFKNLPLIALKIVTTMSCNTFEK